MSLPRNTEMPQFFSAGTTVEYDRTYLYFAPSDGWTLKLYLAGAEIIAPITATTSGDVYTLTIPASYTERVASGVYAWEERVSKNSLVYGVASGKVTIQPNIVVSSAGEMQAWAEKTLVVVEAALTGRLTSDMESYSIAGRSVAKIPISELIEIRARLKSEIFQSKNPETFGQTVLGRFTGTANEPGGSSFDLWKKNG